VSQLFFEDDPSGLFGFLRSDPDVCLFNFMNISSIHIIEQNKKNEIVNVLGEIRKAMDRESIQPQFISSNQFYLVTFTYFEYN
jgi:hypothetical protein